MGNRRGVGLFSALLHEYKIAPDRFTMAVEVVKAHPEAFAEKFKDPGFEKTLADAIASFEAAMGKPRRVIVTRAVAMEQLEALVWRGQGLLVKLDALVDPFEKDASIFVAAWKHAINRCWLRGNSYRNRLPFVAFLGDAGRGSVPPERRAAMKGGRSLRRAK